MQEVCGQRCVGKDVNTMSQCPRTGGGGHTQREDRGRWPNMEMNGRDELKHRCMDVKLQDTEEGREWEASRVQEVHGSRGSKIERDTERLSTMSVQWGTTPWLDSGFHNTVHSACSMEHHALEIFSTFYRTRPFLCLLSPSISSAIPPLHCEISAIFLWPWKHTYKK